MIAQINAKDMRPIDAEYLVANLPPRRRDGHKGTYGRLLIHAGSQKYRGAALLAAEGALRTGVGLVTLASEGAVLDAALVRLPELLLRTCDPISSWGDEEIARRVQESAEASALVVGPGMGVSAALFSFVRALSLCSGAPLVFDADALGAIARYAENVDAFFQSAKRPLLLTPHPLELGRLLGLSAAEVQESRVAIARACARKWGVFLLLKGADTVVTDGETLLINTSGSSALSKGGSGDVLAGAVGAFLAQGAPPLTALALAAYLHGAAGDLLKSRYSEYGYLTGELAETAARVLGDTLKDEK